LRFALQPEWSGVTDPGAAASTASALELIGLAALMECCQGAPDVVIALIDGPVATNHRDLAGDRIREIHGVERSGCAAANSAACQHGTFMAGILCAKRGSAAPAICPGCTLLVRPIFVESVSGIAGMPSSTADELAQAILECIEAGARILNLSLALRQPSANGERELGAALDEAARRGVIVVAAAGNQRMVGSSAITRHPWVISVVACDLQGRPIDYSNLGRSIGSRGLRAPGENITSLGASGDSLVLSGTSVAAPFVTGAVALLWSAFRCASAAEMKLAIGQASLMRRNSVVPPLLNTWRSYQLMLRMYS
jgi:subtilisin family serine protease